MRHHSASGGEPDDLLRDEGKQLQLNITTDPFKYKVDNPGIISSNMKHLLFSEDFADVLILAGTAPQVERV